MMQSMFVSTLVGPQPRYCGTVDGVAEDPIAKCSSFGLASVLDVFRHIDRWIILDISTVEACLKDLHGNLYDVERGVIVTLMTGRRVL